MGSMTAGGCSRTLRAAVFAAVCVLLTSLGHVMMSKAAVPWWAMAAGATVTGGAAWWSGARERGPLLVGSATVAAQAVLHTMFSLAHTAHATGAPPSSAAMEHMGAGPAHAPDHAPGGLPSAGMLAAHLLAAVLCGLWLAHGERAAFRILRAFAGWLTAPLRLLLRPAVPPYRPRIRARRARTDRVARRWLLTHAITSRGPPAGTAVAF